MKKLLLSFSLLTCLATTVFARVTVQTYEFLDTYDQLVNFKGRPGNYFVMDAANTRTGQGGDPTVTRGWAIYVWNIDKGAWYKTAEQESLDASFNETLLRLYPTRTDVSNLVEKVYANIPNKAEIDRQLASMRQSILNMNAKVINVEGSVSDLEAADERLIARITALEEGGGSAANALEAIAAKLTNIGTLKTDQADYSIEDINDKLDTVIKSLKTLLITE